MVDFNFKRLQVADRLLKRYQSEGTSDNVVKNLAELIKNADDGYDALEKDNLKTSGLIEIGYWMKKKNDFQHYLVGYFVRDYGIGMNEDDVKRAFMGKGYGEDTSSDRRNGAIGKGGKDAFYGMEDCFIITIQDKKPIVVAIRTHPTQGVLETDYVTGEKALSVIDEKNEQFHDSVNPIDINQNGTICFFQIPENGRAKRLDALKDHLSKFYTLRNILSDPNRTVRLTHITTGDSFDIEYEKLDVEVLKKSNFQIKFDENVYPVDVLLEKSNEKLEKNSELGNNILVQTERGAILDNFMFGFENDPVANKITGKIVIHNWKNLFRSDNTVLTHNREGLRWLHDFNEELAEKTTQILKPILDAERKKQGPAPTLSKNLDKKVGNALNEINKLLQEEGSDLDVDEVFPEPPDVIQFSQYSIKIPPQTTRKIKLFFNKDKVPLNSEINVSLIEGESSGLKISPIGSIITKEEHYPDKKVPFIEFSIFGEKTCTLSHLKAYFGKIETELQISVVTEDELYPTDGFAFSPPVIRIPKNIPKKIRLLIDTHIFKPGTPISIESSDDRVIVSNNKISVSNPNLGKYLTEEIIEIVSNTPKISAVITANTVSTTTEKRKAVCKVKVTEEEKRGQFFKGYNLDPHNDERTRTRFEDGIVYVHINSPVLLYYFGNNKEKLDQSDPSAIAILADTILSTCIKEWAKKRIEEGQVDILDYANKENEIELERTRLEYKFGSKLHKLITQDFVKN